MNFTHNLLRDGESVRLDTSMVGVDGLERLTVKLSGAIVGSMDYHNGGQVGTLDIKTPLDDRTLLYVEMSQTLRPCLSTLGERPVLIEWGSGTLTAFSVEGQVLASVTESSQVDDEITLNSEGDIYYIDLLTAFYFIGYGAR